MEKVLHTFSIMKVSVPFIGPFSNDVTVVTQVQPHEIRTHANSELTKNSDSRKLYAILKLSYHKKS